MYEVLVKQEKSSKVPPVWLVAFLFGEKGFDASLPIFHSPLLEVFTSLLIFNPKPIQDKTLNLLFSLSISLSLSPYAWFDLKL